MREDNAVPKLKTHSGATKRFKLTANGKVKRGHSLANHILTKKSAKTKRNSRGTELVAERDRPLLERMLPYR